MQGEGFVTARTPPRWFPSKQQAVELLEVDVPPPPGEAHLREPQGGGPEDGDGEKKSDQGSEEWQGRVEREGEG